MITILSTICLYLCTITAKPCRLGIGEVEKGKWSSNCAITLHSPRIRLTDQSSRYASWPAYGKFCSAELTSLILQCVKQPRSTAARHFVPFSSDIHQEKDRSKPLCTLSHLQYLRVLILLKFDDPAPSSTTGSQKPLDGPNYQSTHWLHGSTELDLHCFFRSAKHPSFVLRWLSASYSRSRSRSRSHSGPPPP